MVCFKKSEKEERQEIAYKLKTLRAISEEAIKSINANVKKFNVSFVKDKKESRLDKILFVGINKSKQTFTMQFELFETSSAFPLFLRRTAKLIFRYGDSSISSRKMHYITKEFNLNSIRSKGDEERVIAEISTAVIERIRKLFK